jgi:hypothetical protein
VHGAGRFISISCPAAQSCLAITDSAAFVFDGSSWKAAGDIPKAKALIDVGCSSDDDCVIVDVRGDALTHTGPWS